MVGQMFETFFIRCYVLVKLNLYFWGLTLIGGVLAGIGPALLTINQLFATYEWAYDQLTVKAAWQIYKENFKRGNAICYLFLVAFSIVGYNLFIAVQLKGPFFFGLVFILGFALLFLTISFNFFLQLNSHFDTSFRELLKLATITFFTNFFLVLKVLGGLLVIGLLTYRFPGLILFATIALTQVTISFFLKGWFSKINENLAITEGDFSEETTEFN